MIPSNEFSMAKYLIDNRYSSELLEDVKARRTNWIYNQCDMEVPTHSGQRISEWPNQWKKAHLSMKNRKTFQCTRFFIFKKDKNTPTKLPQSANTIAKLTGLPDLLHTFKNHLSASSRYEWAKNKRKQKSVAYSQVKIKKKKKQTNSQLRKDDASNARHRLH